MDYTQYAGVPRPSKEIAKEATEFGYTHFTPLARWLRSCDSMWKQSQIYLDEGDDERAFFLLVRLSDLVVQHLPSHPEASIPEYRRALRKQESRLPVVIKQMENLRPRINDRYFAWEQQQATRRSLSSASSSLRRAQRSADIDHDHQIALELARQEFDKRERERRAAQGGHDSTGREIVRVATPVAPSPSPSPAPSSPVSQYAPPLGGYLGYGSDEEGGQQRAPLPRRPTNGEDLSRSLQKLHMHPALNPDAQTFRYDHAPSRDRDKVSRSSYAYPSVPKRAPFALPSPRPRPPSSSFDESAVPPPLPRKPAAASELPSPLPTPPPKFSPAPAPAPKETPYTFGAGARLESGAPLRSMFLPAALRSQFLRMAAPNTSANLETCGILCGALMQNALFVSRLVIPEQDATSDTCTTRDEEGLFEYCESEDLIVLGWIHTHPTQTCFMSSVDLHTQAGYQLMLPESIAIVCAPSRQPSFGIFRLTDPPGVQAITACRRPGLFHPHDVDNVYTDATRPGHVKEVKDMGFDVVDLRKR